MYYNVLLFHVLLDNVNLKGTIMNTSSKSQSLKNIFSLMEN